MNKHAQRVLPQQASCLPTTEADVGAENFRVTNYHELLAIHKVMLEARFSDQPFDQDISGNPITALLHERVIEKLRDIDAKNNDNEADAAWEQWLTLSPERREWTIALNRALTESRWNDWDEMDQRFYAMTLLSPFDVSESLLAEFIYSVKIERAKHLQE